MLVVYQKTHVHPDLAVTVRDHYFGRSLGIAPVFFHQEVAAHGELALGVDRDGLALVGWVDDLGFDVGHESADGAEAFVEGVVGGGHGGDGGCLGHAVADGQFGEVESVVQFLHELVRDGASSSDARPQILEAFVGHFAACDEAQFFEEHRGHTVECRTFLLLHGGQGRARVE